MRALAAALAALLLCLFPLDLLFCFLPPTKDILSFWEGRVWLRPFPVKLVFLRDAKRHLPQSKTFTNLAISSVVWSSPPLQASNKRHAVFFGRTRLTPAFLIPVVASWQRQRPSSSTQLWLQMGAEGHEVKIPGLSLRGSLQIKTHDRSSTHVGDMRVRGWTWRTGLGEMRGGLRVFGHFGRCWRDM